MFTGIIEALGTVIEVTPTLGNIEFRLTSPFTNQLKIDQSLAHNGVCLTVTGIEEDVYSVTAVKETLEKSNLGSLQPGDSVNLERCMKADGRLDGHIVQGHVDTTGVVTRIEDHEGSRKFTFSHPGIHQTVPKGSITVNGVSLTVVDSSRESFSVVIIPYTFEHTTFRTLNPGDSVNLEFDIIGKYIAALMKPYQKD